MAALTNHSTVSESKPGFTRRLARSSIAGVAQRAGLPGLKLLALKLDSAYGHWQNSSEGN